MLDTQYFLVTLFIIQLKLAISSHSAQFQLLTERDLKMDSHTLD